MYVQMRMIACLAYMGGYDTNSDQVQTLVYACLAGISIDQIIKQAGIKFGTKFTTAMVKKIPGTVLTKINQKVGFRFLTKFGEKDWNAWLKSSLSSLLQALASFRFISCLDFRPKPRKIWKELLFLQIK